MQKDDVGGGGGPFAYFPVSASAIHEAAAEIDSHTSELDSIRRQLHDEHRSALGAVEGVLVEPMTKAPGEADTRATSVLQRTTYAAACVHLFGDFVDAHDHTSSSPRSVEHLNLAYAEAKLNDFGLDETEYEKGGAYARRDYEADWRARYAGLVGSLTTEYRRLQARLDDRAESIAAMLRAGPTPDNLRVIWTVGAMPSRAGTIWPDIGLDAVPLLRLPPDLRDGYDDHRNLYDLTDEELFDLAEYDSEADGFRPAGELFAVRMQADDSSNDVPEPMGLLDDWAGVVLLDPRECIGDGASLGNCGVEVLGLLPIGKPLKAIKAYRAARRLERAPEPGPEVPPIHAGRQGKHLPDHPHFDPDGTKSILEADPLQLRKLAGTGMPRNTIPRGDLGFREVVDYGFPVGKYVSDDGKTVLETTNAIIVYAKDGIHIYPARP